MVDTGIRNIDQLEEVGVGIGVILGLWAGMVKVDDGKQARMLDGPAALLQHLPPQGFLQRLIRLAPPAWYDMPFITISQHEDAIIAKYQAPHRCNILFRRKLIAKIPGNCQMDGSIPPDRLLLRKRRLP